MAHRVSGSHPLLQLGLQLGFGEGTTRAVMVRLAAAHTRGEPCRLTLTHQDIFLDALTGGGGDLEDSQVHDRVGRAGRAAGGRGFVVDSSGSGSATSSDDDQQADDDGSSSSDGADDDDVTEPGSEDVSQEPDSSGDIVLDDTDDNDDDNGNGQKPEDFREEDYLEVIGFRPPPTCKRPKVAPSGAALDDSAPQSACLLGTAPAPATQRIAPAGGQGRISSFFKRLCPAASAAKTTPAAPIRAPELRDQPGTNNSAMVNTSQSSGVASRGGDGLAQWRAPATAEQEAMPLIDLVNLAVFGNASFRPQQRLAIDAALDNHDVFLLMPTGGGKSLCYQLPAVICRGITVVVCPLLSLMQDQVSALCNQPACGGVPATYISSQQSRVELLAVLQDLNKTSPVSKLLYVTPEQLVRSNALLNVLSRLHSAGRLSRFVIDEAHCVSMWGHDFRTDYKQLGCLKRSYPGVPIMAVTATATDRVAADILSTLGMRSAKVFKGSFFRSNLMFTVIDKPSGVDENGRSRPFAALVDYIQEQGEGTSGIVYCLSRDESETVARVLEQMSGIPTAHYHAGMTPKQRLNVQNDWRCGIVHVVVATIAFGMGIDKPDVRFVVHYTISKSIEGYFQEAGRAGRDGLASECVIFFAPRDRSRVMNLIRLGPKKSYDSSVTQLESMLEYCAEEKRCRHDILLRYFSDTGSLPEVGCCRGACDNCARRLRLPGAPPPRTAAGDQDAAAARRGGSTKRKAHGGASVAGAAGFVKASFMPRSAAAGAGGNCAAGSARAQQTGTRHGPEHLAVGSKSFRATGSDAVRRPFKAPSAAACKAGAANNPSAAPSASRAQLAGAADASAASAMNAAGKAAAARAHDMRAAALAAQASKRRATMVERATVHASKASRNESDVSF